MDDARTDQLLLGPEQLRPWTETGADRLRAAADALAAAIRTHAESVIQAGRDGNPVDVFAANDVFQAVVLEYSEAEYDFTGLGSPLLAMEQDDEELPA